MKYFYDNTNDKPNYKELFSHFLRILPNKSQFTAYQTSKLRYKYGINIVFDIKILNSINTNVDIIISDRNNILESLYNHEFLIAKIYKII